MIRCLHPPWHCRACPPTGTASPRATIGEVAPLLVAGTQGPSPADSPHQYESINRADPSTVVGYRSSSAPTVRRPTRPRRSPRPAGPRTRAPRPRRGRSGAGDRSRACIPGSISPPGQARSQPCRDRSAPHPADQSRGDHDPPVGVSTVATVTTAATATPIHHRRSTLG